MNKYIGQSKDEWRKQIQDLPSIKKLNGKKKKIAIEISMKYLHFNSHKDDLLMDVFYRLQCNYSRIDRKYAQRGWIKTYDSYDENYSNISDYPCVQEEYGEIFTPEKESINTIRAKIAELYDKGYIQQLRSKNKDGIIDAEFIINLEYKKIGGKKDQIDFAQSLTVSEWKDIFNQTTILGKKRGIDIIPALEIDSHFCKIFDVKNAQKFMPELEGNGLREVWDSTIGTSLSIMRNYLDSKPRKGQLECLALTIFCNDIIELGYELFIDHYDELLNKRLNELNIVNMLPKTEEDIKKFIRAFNKEYCNFFTGTKKEFIKIYKISEKTFYRRQKENFLPFRNQFFKDDGSGRFLMDVPNYFKQSYPKKPFGIYEEK